MPTRKRKRGEGSIHCSSIVAACEALEVRRLLSTVYVDLNAPGPTHDGTSWTTAYADLQPVLTAAVSGTTIDVAQGMYYPTTGTNQSATFQLKSGVEIDGGFAGATNPAAPRDVTAYPTILSGDIGVAGNVSDNSFHVVTAFGTDVTAILDGFTITGGNAVNNGGGGLSISNAALTVNNCVVSANSAYNGGGVSIGVAANFKTFPTFTNCMFEGNTATSVGGGAVYDSNASTVFNNCQFQGNFTASNGKGGAIYAAGSSMSLVLTNTTISGNSTSGTLGFGGGIYLNSGQINLTACTVIGNISVAAQGGGIYSNNSNGFVGRVSASNCLFSGNTAFGTAGLGFTSSSPISGGGAIFSGGLLTVTGCTFILNTVADGSGGAIDAEGAASITNCDFTDNAIYLTAKSRPPIEGGALLLHGNPASEMVNSCQFDGNSALGSQGGAIGGYGNETDCTFVGNSAAGGGAIYGFFGRGYTGFATINCTFTDNTATSGYGGALSNESGSIFTLVNCLLWNDAGSKLQEIDNINSTILVTNSDIRGGYPGAGNISANPLFFRNPTPGLDGVWGTADDDYGNLQLSSGSSCIGAGSTSALPSGTTTDLAGNPRVVGSAVDMGAYEFQPQSALYTLIFIQSPSNTIAGNTINPAIVVMALNGTGSIVTDISLTLAIDTGPAFSLFGTPTEATNSVGLATFSDISLQTAGTYTLAATAGYSGVQSASFTITPAPVSRLAFIQQPTAVISGGILTPAVTIGAFDPFNNSIVGDAIALAINNGATLSGKLTQSTGSNGIATFSDLSVLQSGNFILTASDTNLLSINSTSFYVAPQLVFVQQPTTEVAGVAIAPAIVVEAEDDTGSPIPGIPITISIFSGPTATLAGVLTQTTGSNGMATFAGITLNTSGSYSLEASATSTSQQSLPFTVNPSAPTPPAKQSGPYGASAGQVFQLNLLVQDQYNNPISGIPISLSIVGGVKQTFYGTLTQTTGANGVATFPGLSLQTAGVVTIQAADVLDQLSSTFNFAVVPASLASLTFASEPVTTAGHALISDLAVKAQDAYGNTITAAPVTISTSSGPAAAFVGIVTGNIGSNGIATFPDLSLKTAGTFTITAADGAIVSAQSSPFTITPQGGTIDYVDASATGADDGSSWGNAFNNLQYAFDDVIATAIIRVARGNYISDFSRGITSFQLLDGVEVDGGFAGNANPNAPRNVADYPTSLNAANGSGVDSTAILDGFSLAALPIISGSPTIENCQFNDSIDPLVNQNAAPTLINCVFMGNLGTAVTNYNSSPTFINCTFTANSGNNAGAFYNSNSSPILTNCILWNDTLTGRQPSEIVNADPNSIPVVTYSDIDGGYPGVGNVNFNPEFINSAAGNLQLQVGSNCINVGSNAAIPAGVTTDLAGAPRIVDGTVDLGAYECTSAFFTGAADQHSFNNPGNWSGHAVPGPYDVVTIPGNVIVRTPSGSPTTITLAGLILHSGSLFDLESNTLAINFTGSDPVSTLRGYLHSAYNGGNWKGASGLTSSTIAAQVAAATGTTGGVYALGYADGNVDGIMGGAALNQIIIHPVLAADANLDDQVNFNDLLILAQNNGSITADWVHGDFNYDGVVSFQDLLTLAQNINKTDGDIPLAFQVPASVTEVINPVFSSIPLIQPANMEAASSDSILDLRNRRIIS